MTSSPAVDWTRLRGGLALFLAQTAWGALCGLGIVLAAILPYVVSVQDDPFKAPYANSSIWIPSFVGLIMGAGMGFLAYFASRLAWSLVRTRVGRHPRLYLTVPAAAFVVCIADGLLVVGPLLSLFPVSYSLISLVSASGAAAWTVLLTREPKRERARQLQ